MKYSMPCGCTFEQESESIKDYDGLPPISIDYYNLNMECPRTWDLVSSGRTRGVFQLESNLGRSYASKLQPDNIDHLAALIAILRPGCVSGDTKVTVLFNTNKNGNRQPVTRTLEFLYKNRGKFKKIISYNEDTGLYEQNKVLDIIYTGVKPVFKIKCRKYLRDKWSNIRYDLKCTEDHKLLTLRGWVELRDMVVGDRFVVTRSRNSGRIPIKHIAGKSGFRDVCFKNYEYKCICCDWNNGSLDVNHLDGNRLTDNSSENLCFMCPNHHRQYSEGTISKEQAIKLREPLKLKHTEHVEWAEYLGKEYVEDTKVYDISMEAPHHNFIAGGVIVHNCMNSVLEGKSMTNHYVDRKHNREPVTYIDDRLAQYLDTTFGILVYQEQAIAIAKGLARFTPEQANALRKAIGKKKADELAKLRDAFIAGCILSGLDPEIALQLFDNIESSNRYAFNASHSYTYSFITYATAYAKAHFPLHFFCAALKQIKDMDELKDLMSEVALFDLEVLGPSISNPLSRFNITNGRIQYGWSEIRKSGHKDVVDFINHIVEVEKKLNKEATAFTWYEFLILVAPEMRSDAMVNLISCGILDGTGVSRKEQLHEFNMWQELSGGDKKWIVEHYSKYESLQGVIKGLIDSGKIQEKRKSKINGVLSTLQKPGKSLSDNVDFVCDIENELMGYSCSMNRTADKEKFANIKIYDFLLGKGNKNLAFVVEVKSVDERIIKTGKNAGKKMANIKLADRSGEMECSIFSADWLKQKTNVVKDNVLLIRGSRHQDMSLKIEDVSVI